jgi:hypothetical protein
MVKMHIKVNVNHDFVQALKVLQTVAVYSKCCVISYALISLSFESVNFVSTRTVLCKHKFLSISPLNAE